MRGWWQSDAHVTVFSCREWRRVAVEEEACVKFGRITARIFMQHETVILLKALQIITLWAIALKL